MLNLICLLHFTDFHEESADYLSVSIWKTTMKSKHFVVRGRCPAGSPPLWSPPLWSTEATAKRSQLSFGCQVQTMQTYQPGTSRPLLLPSLAFQNHRSLGRAVTRDDLTRANISHLLALWHMCLACRGSQNRTAFGRTRAKCLHVNEWKLTVTPQSTSYHAVKSHWQRSKWQ